MEKKKKKLVVGLELRPVVLRSEHVVAKVNVSAPEPSVGVSFSYFVLYFILFLLCCPPSIALRMNEQ